jgi:hypothetical protein
MKMGLLAIEAIHEEDIGNSVSLQALNFYTLL